MAAYVVEHVTSYVLQRTMRFGAVIGKSLLGHRVRGRKVGQVIDRGQLID